MFRTGSHRQMSRVVLGIRFRPSTPIVHGVLHTTLRANVTSCYIVDFRRKIISFRHSSSSIRSITRVFETDTEQERCICEAQCKVEYSCRTTSAARSTERSIKSMQSRTDYRNLVFVPRQCGKLSTKCQYPNRRPKETRDGGTSAQALSSGKRICRKTPLRYVPELIISVSPGVSLFPATHILYSFPYFFHCWSTILHTRADRVALHLVVPSSLLWVLMLSHLSSSRCRHETEFFFEAYE